jgi:hypothetical protein
MKPLCLSRLKGSDPNVTRRKALIGAILKRQRLQNEVTAEVVATRLGSGSTTGLLRYERGKLFLALRSFLTYHVLSIRSWNRFLK